MTSLFVFSCPSYAPFWSYVPCKNEIEIGVGMVLIFSVLIGDEVYIACLTFGQIP